MSIITAPNVSTWTDARQEFHARNLLRTPSVFEHFLEQDVHQTIHGRFEQIAERHPTNVAIKTPEWSLTYQALNQRANQIAHTLIEQFGNEPEQVAFLLPNDGTAIAALLGILKAGKSYVPLDPLFPQDRLVYMLKDSRASFIVTDNANQQLASELQPDAKLVNLDALADTISTSNPGVHGDPRALAYILYTSGSTGLPKGIGFAHFNLLHTTMCLVNSLRISPDDRVTQMHSTSFAASIVDIYCALTAGATLYPWDVKSRGFIGLADWLRSERVTCFLWIPTPFRHFMDTFEPDERLPDVRIVVMASEPLTQKERNLHRQHFAADSLLINQMGTSESHNYNLHFISHDSEIDSYIMPAGYSVSEDREVLILDDAHHSLPQGETGEIAIKTEYMSLGYWQQPDLTAEKFLPDPAGSDKRIYLTGDLGMIREDGCLIHQGRADFQVKIRGYRIEITEIEKALSDHPDIRDAVVVAKDTATGDKQLVAYVMPKKLGALLDQRVAVPSNGTALENATPVNPSGGVNGADFGGFVDEVKDYLGQQLPEYMVPPVFVKVDAFPTTATGKMDRMKLPEPGQTAQRQPDLPTVEPTTPTETHLARIWSKLLGIGSISTNQSFFELGGHSLLAARLFFDIEKEMGVRVPLATLFHAQTVAELARVIDGESVPVSWNSLTPIRTEGSRPPLYLIHAHGGNVLGYYELASYLDENQPIYGLQAIGLDGISIQDRTFDEIAAAYIEEIRRLQPHGPYYLSGYCFGGNMAFAMAQQLRKAGEEVALLALVDAGHQEYPQYPESASSVDRLRSKLKSRIAFEWESATSEGLASVWPHIQARFTRTKDIVQIKAEHKLHSFAPKVGLSFRQSQLYIQERLEQVHDRAYYGYHPESYDGDMVLFRAEHQPPGIIRDDSMGWADVVQGTLTMHELPGFPVGLLDEPRVQILAKILQEHLHSAQEGQRTSFATGRFSQM